MMTVLLGPVGAGATVTTGTEIDGAGPAAVSTPLGCARMDGFGGTGAVAITGAGAGAVDTVMYACPLGVVCIGMADETVCVELCLLAFAAAAAALLAALLAAFAEKLADVLAPPPLDCVGVTCRL